MPMIQGLRREFSSLRSIELLRSKITHWLVIPSDGPDFEREALHSLRSAVAARCAPGPHPPVKTLAKRCGGRDSSWRVAQVSRLRPGFGIRGCRQGDCAFREAICLQTLYKGGGCSTASTFTARLLYRLIDTAADVLNLLVHHGQ